MKKLNILSGFTLLSFSAQSSAFGIEGDFSGLGEGEIFLRTIILACNNDVAVFAEKQPLGYEHLPQKNSLVVAAFLELGNLLKENSNSAVITKNYRNVR